MAATAVASIAPLTGACSGQRDIHRQIRIGFLTNLTHATALVAARGQDKELWKQSITAAIEMVPFAVGPAVMEALSAGELDMAYVGPPPIINAYLRGRRYLPRIVSGGCSGGASFILRKGLVFEGPSSLKGKTLASPQIGNTQDVALRSYLLENQVPSVEHGGSVKVVPMSNMDAFQLMKRDRLDGAWVPEPWATRMVEQIGAQRVIDERTLWPQGRFPTTVLVASEPALRTAPDVVESVIRAHEKTTQRLVELGSAAATEVGEALGKLLEKKLPPQLIASAFRYLDVTSDPVHDALALTAQRMNKLGYTPARSVDGLVATAQSPRAELKQ